MCPAPMRPSVVMRDVTGESLRGFPATGGDEKGGRYWVRTSDLFGVNEARYHCANRPSCGGNSTPGPGALSHPTGKPSREASEEPGMPYGPGHDQDPTPPRRPDHGRALSIG